ncbi:MAG: hypothetical protein HYX32_15280 [Actinobacteria bacterium]|nr:hypothetical protein [Actinomycetota bacterium]
MRRIVSGLSFLLVLTVTACGAGTNATTGTAPARESPGTTAVPVVKETLASEVDPPGAPGRTLTLARYTIAPDAQLSPHIHPGVQLASIQAGTLTYTVVSGTATLTRANGTTDEVTGPATVALDAGDAVAENDGMVHFGANRTGAPVVILATLLTQSDSDLAVTVTTTATGTTR